jgi:SP family myo-inositol transporter-like MFS transporter 13
MGILSELDKNTEATHVERVGASPSVSTSENLDELDTIEQTQSGKFAWLVSVTAGVGGLLFGMPIYAQIHHRC